MTETVKPALSPGEWVGVLAQADQLLAIRAGISGTPFSVHALAALFLYDQPFGFAADDVIDERGVAAYCDAMATRHETEGDGVSATSFRGLARRHRLRAEKIAALLPPLPPLSETSLPLPGEAPPY
ncbi:MAG: hypothetical protein NVS4B3_13280 [Gemmatimonadaceae bacterium]